MKKIAPIGIITYKRLEHLKKTIKALQNNHLAQESNLYIFSDAPKKGDEAEVDTLRNYLKEIDGFKNISIICRKSNSRRYNSLNAQTMLMEKYEKMIFFEEDIVTNQFFLKYMNDMLNFYKNEKKIFAICGYIPNITFPDYYNHDYFFSKRFSPWGFATWKDRGSVEALSNYNAYLDLMSNPLLLIKGYMISKKTPTFSLRQIYKYKEHRGDALLWAKQLKNNQYCIMPTRSLISNIGLDGSGLHCGIMPEYKTSNNQHSSSLRVSKHVKYDKRIDRIFCEWYNKPKKPKGTIKQALLLARSLKESLFYNLFGRI